MLRLVTVIIVVTMLAGPGMARAEAPLGVVGGTLGGAERSWQTRLDGPRGGPGTTAVERFAILHAVSLGGYPTGDAGDDGLGVLSIRLSVAPSGQRVLAARVLYFADSHAAFYSSPPDPGAVKVSLDRYAAAVEIAGRVTTTLCWQADPLSARDTERCRDLDVAFETGLPPAE